ncbi:hypothetical protein SLEP1_g5779 [Rubroshorea leprosula]|uniref:NADH dehydrogenase subunit 1 n=1 Tax=Rubroshorea leprosula TaxID=152421 RepID=A0AAV5HTB5_9ROSI|nr:hypothetical protein SLEP1_g5779 [Rubroshorea leprosula]
MLFLMMLYIMPFKCSFICLLKLTILLCTTSFFI